MSELNPFLVGRNTKKNKRFVNVFAREMLPKCRENVPIALVLVSQFFFLKLRRFSKIPFDV